MRSAEEYKKWLETEEGKKYIEEFKTKIERLESKRREVINTDNYIKWLEEFTKEHPTFNDQNWLYRPEEISKEDNQKVDMLSTFYSAIDVYARANYIYPTPCDFGGYYSIGYNGKVYEIGLLIGQGALTFCNTNDVNKNVSVIPFEEIANPTSETIIRTALIENQLSRIDDLFEALCASKLGIPIEAMIDWTNKVLEELKNKK